jgi:biotin transporter BioY
MELNLTFGHLAGFIMMAWIAASFAEGARLTRCIGFIALWQLLSPVRAWYLDVPLMLSGFAAVELIYAFVVKTKTQ